MLTSAKPHVRWMIQRDLPQVVQIEQSSFVPPWAAEDWRTHLRPGNVIGQVAELRLRPGDDDGAFRVIACMAYELRKSSIGVTRLAVHPDFRRCGVGSLMLEKLYGKLSPYRRRSLKLEVPEDDLGAQLFLKAARFKAVQVARGEEGERDRYRFARRLPTESQE